MIESDIKRLIYTATEDFMNESAVGNASPLILMISSQPTTPEA